MVLQAIDYQPASSGKPASLQILDQLLLPHTSVYVPINTCEDGFKAIKQMQVRGAPAIAIVAALALATELSQATRLPGSPADARQHIVERLEYLKTSRPTAVNLGDAVRKLSKIATEASTVTDANAELVISRYIEAAERMLVDDVADNKAIGVNGAKWILQNTAAGRSSQDGSSHELKVLTICNTGSLATAGYGTALGVIRALREAGHLTHAYACETRPYNQGSRLTAYELVHDQIPATLITDSMAAALMAKEHSAIAAVVVGADRVAANGDTANKIGTYSLAVLARFHRIKFLVAAPRTTIDLATPSGKDIVIEQRPPHEVTRVKGPRILGDESLGEATVVSTAATGIHVWNPSFDVTPADLIDGVITEMGVVEKRGGIFDFNPLFEAMSEAEASTKPSTIGSM